MHYMYTNVSAIEYNICPSFLLGGDPGDDLKWRVFSASHLYAQYIICATLAAEMIKFKALG